MTQAPPPYKKYNDGGATSSAAKDDGDDIYQFGTVLTALKCDIEYGKTIGEGRFAMILKARMPNKQDVAAKCLRSKFVYILL